MSDQLDFLDIYNDAIKLHDKIIIKIKQINNLLNTSKLSNDDDKEHIANILYSAIATETILDNFIESISLTNTDNTTNNINYVDFSQVN